MRLTTRLLCVPFSPQRVLGITQLTYWDFMKLRYPDLDEKQFYDKLMTLKLRKHPDVIYSEHKRHLECEIKFTEIMQKFGCNFKMIKDLNKAKDHIEWADLIVSIGGDGTFLLAAQLIKNNKKAVIGVNPKFQARKSYFSNEYCSEIEKIFQKLHKGKYNLLMRRRIRTVMYEDILSSEFHQKNEKKMELSNWDKMKEKHRDKKFDVTQSTETKVADALQPERRVLPWLALNEIYIGEFLSTGTTVIAIYVDDKEEEQRIQCSGICVCTGSGSRNWFRSMNLQTTETVKRLVKIAMGKDICDEEALRVLRSYHQNLIYDPEDDRISYMIREMYRANSWPKPKWAPERAMCRKIKVMSHSFNAGLVIDGGVTVPFNEGTGAVFEIHPEDCLKNFILQ